MQVKSSEKLKTAKWAFSRTGAPVAFGGMIWYNLVHWSLVRLVLVFKETGIKMKMNFQHFSGGIVDVWRWSDCGKHLRRP